MEIKYDKPIEVNKNQYQILMTQFAGAVAGREENNKYYIKVWIMEYKKHIQEILLR